ncbi:glycoside hydrolase family 113 [Winogradskyella ouciana]|uniref:glycoside hydrolase family 113 n=1 Tax=Winogradskyella ouciana TaxID=2608631 RepID=UPI003D2C4416
MRYFLQFLLVFVLVGCAAVPFKPVKFNGVSFVAARGAVDTTHVNPLVNVGANSAAIMPFGFIRNLDNPTIVHNTNRQWYGETRAGAKQYIEELRKANIKIMVKPQLWITHGFFTGFLEMKTEANWKLLESSYLDFILEYAELAEEVNAEIFCIGTELENFIKHRPEYWNGLIIKIKNIYKGKLTYAANWDEYKRTPFWDQLDYVGIDAYFPISNEKTPSVEDCLKGWEKHKPMIKQFSEQLNRPILFTEYGYRSVDFSGKEPWQSDHTMRDVNLEAQVNTTKALFETFWKEDWFAGGFVWKWFHKHDKVGGAENPMFTPQNKPVEKVIQSYYTKYN